ncbi:MAG: thioredoxin family protein, partial [Desulfobacterota bacterium]|nr:thioredoxin family protein [Thermodesulfobacteriota bacterium]
QQLDAVSWKNKKVVNLVHERFIPVRISGDNQRELFKQHLVTWTPTIVINDYEGKEHYRFTGFLSPEELCSRILLEGAKTSLDLKNYELAINWLNEVIENYPGSFAIPEAIFYSGVAKYLYSHNPKPLKEGWIRLSQEFSQSEWALRAKPYALLND